MKATLWVILVKFSVLIQENLPLSELKNCFSFLKHLCKLCLNIFIVSNHTFSVRGFGKGFLKTSKRKLVLFFFILK